MKTAILCVASLALIQTLLGLAVSVCRWKYRMSAGCPDDPNHPMFRIRTAYDNCSEWHPQFMVLMPLIAIAGGPAWSIWVYPAVVSARLLVVAGLVTFPVVKPNIYRFSGAALTYLTSLTLVFLLFWSYFPNAPVQRF
jgi:uncharacterized membrane protein YecN with MAPEG domain